MSGAVAAAAIAACIEMAAGMYGLPVEIVTAVQHVEGGTVGTVVGNRNGSVDMGPMQVNSEWIPRLARMYGVSEGTIRDRLVNDPCFNVKVGTWILAGEIAEAGDFWKGVGRYNSPSASIGRQYVGKVAKAVVRLYGRDAISDGALR